MTFGQALRLARERRGKTVWEAAKIFNVSESAWNYWEAGRFIPKGRYKEPIQMEWPEIRQFQLIPQDSTK